MIILRQKNYGIVKKIKKYIGRKTDEYKTVDENINKKLLETAKDNNVDAVVSSTNRHSSFVPINGKNFVFVNKKQGGRENNTVLAHELGHSYYVSGKGQDKLGGKIHKLDSKINEAYLNLSKKLSTRDKNTSDNAKKKKVNLKHITGSTVSGLSGIAAGYKSEEEKEKGNKKKARLISAGSLAVPVLGHTPELGREIAASKKGLEYLKKAGADKKQLKGSKKSMRYALGMYGINLGNNILINTSGQLVGKGAYKLTHKKKKENKQ